MLRRHVELDLILIDILTLALVLIVFTSSMPWLRILLGFPFVIFFPGYVLVAALFPRKSSLSVTARVALSLGLSIAVVVFIGLILNFTPWGIGLYSLLLSLFLFILFASGIVWYVRGRIGPEEKFSIDFRLPLASLSPTLRTAGKRYLSLVIILLFIILGGIGALGYVMAKPVIGQPFTEFYILGIDGKAESYPQELTPGEEGKVIVGIVNHEHEEMYYRLEVIADGNKLYQLPPIQLMPEENWEEVIGFAIQEIGNRQKVEFLLYKGSEPVSEIRYLWVNVRA